jgi:hypothetical protein
LNRGDATVDAGAIMAMEVRPGLTLTFGSGKLGTPCLCMHWTYLKAASAGLEWDPAPVLAGGFDDPQPAPTRATVAMIRGVLIGIFTLLWMVDAVVDAAW